MKNKLLPLVLFFILSFISKVLIAQTWVQKSDFAGIARYSPSYFSVGDKGYIGMGYTSGRNTDMWEYDPLNDNWTQMASYPGLGRNASACFTIGNMGFVAGGGNGVNSPTEFYGFNPSINSWVLKSPFNMIFPPQDCFGFSIETNG